MKELKIMFVSENNIFSPSSGFANIAGKEALAQRIVKLLLTAKGSDFFNPSQGCTLLSLYGVYNDASLENVKRALPIVISDFVDNVKSEQEVDLLNGIIYDDSDLLEDILIENITFDKTYSGWAIELRIINRAKDSIKIVVP